MKIAINNRAVSSPPLPAAMSLSTIPVIDFQKYGLQINKPESVHRDDLKELGNKMCRAIKICDNRSILNNWIFNVEVL
jgi:hypothetical protein